MRDHLRISQADGLRLSPEELEVVLGGQRQRFLDTFGSFGADRWAAATRCTGWDAHTTFRHMTDAAELHASGYTGEAPSFAGAGGDFNPQTTPDVWLAFSADESPADTLERYRTASEIVVERAVAEHTSGSQRIAGAPYGEAHWSTMLVHILWDAWLHERDIVLADQAAAPIAYGATEAQLAALYAVLMTTVPFLRIDGELSGTIRLDQQDGIPVHVRFGGSADGVGVEQIDATDTDVFGDLLPTADALGGRGAVQDVLSGDAEIAEKMSYVGMFI